MGARGGEPATSAQVAHYTFVRDWHDGDGDAAVIAVKADESRCRTEDCEEDPDDGEGWSGFCGNCADRRCAAGIDDDD